MNDMNAKRRILILWYYMMKSCNVMLIQKNTYGTTSVLLWKYGSTSIPFILNKNTTKVSNPLNDIIIFYIYYMCQACDEILNLKHEIRPFVYLKVNGGLLLYHFENIGPHEYLLVKSDANKVRNSHKTIYWVNTFYIDRPK